MHAGVNDEDPIPVAYFPESLFDFFFFKASQVVLGGHALKSKTTTPPLMGSGAFGSEWDNAAMIRDIHVIMEDGRSNFIDDDLSTDVTDVKLYSLSPISAAKFAYGGPGRKNY